MLPARFRLRGRRDFSETVKTGVRAGRPCLVVHLAPVATNTRRAADTTDAPLARGGFVVSKAVGGSVVRHAVTRRLRPLLVDRLPALPAGTRVVVRALPPAATATSAELARDLDAALARASTRLPVTTS